MPSIVVYSPEKLLGSLVKPIVGIINVAFDDLMTDLYKSSYDFTFKVYLQP